MSALALDLEGRPDATILLVEDVPMFRELECLFLSRFGRVVTLSRGREALGQIRREAPDLLVSAMRLPDIAGDELCREIRATEAGRTLPIVLLASGNPEDHANAVRAGADDVLARPLSRSGLLGAVARFLADPDHPRGLPRIDLDRPVELVIGESRKGGRLRNLSRGGAFIDSDWVPPEGSEIELRFDLPETAAPVTQLRTTARCVWRRHHPSRGAPGMGVRFVDLDGETWRELDAWVHERFVPDVVSHAAPTLS